MNWIPVVSPLVHGAVWWYEGRELADSVTVSHLNTKEVLQCARQIEDVRRILLS